MLGQPNIFSPLSSLVFTVIITTMIKLDPANLAKVSSVLLRSVITTSGLACRADGNWLQAF